ncbi:MAG: PDZ domain-containing protein [Pirellulaceae bacterium]|nr:PDZ domain-containing protein [Pirellulaceae bacterium]
MPLHRVWLRLVCCSLPLSFCLLPLLAGSAAADVQEDEERALKAAVEAVAPAVLRIETFGGLEKVDSVLVGTGPTTGLAVSEDGYILSSAFNFVQKPSSILVTLPSGKRATADIVARDESRMLVLLKVAADEKLLVPQAVPRDEMVVGQWSIAVGRTFELGQPNVSVGVLSATNRIWGKALQTDAKISPSNYGGPLVDIQGRVLGILVPLSPQRQGEVAGAEWYDSGIGFAVPLADVYAQLDKLKSGSDLKPGLLGVSLKRGDIYATPAEVAACPAKSPAYEAGLRVGDTIVEVNGKPVARQAQLRHALGPHYAGDQVQVVAERKGQRQEFVVTLAETIEPYERPFLGVLPNRDPPPEGGGVPVRFVFPGSPAAQAGIQAGDVLTALGDERLPDSRTLQDGIARLEPGNAAKLVRLRDGEPQDVTVALATVPSNVVDQLPPARGDLPLPDQRPAVGKVEIKLPEEKNEAFAWVPENYNPQVPYGLVVWLQSPQEYDFEKLAERWKSHCEAHDLILLAPKSADARRWLPTEVDIVRKLVDSLAVNYPLDPRRVVVGGYQAGGAMALLVAFGHRDLVRGVAVVDASLPRGGAVPDNDPIERLDYYVGLAAKSPQAARIRAGVEQLQKIKAPVTVTEMGDTVRDLNDEELSELARWVDSLDRI